MTRIEETLARAAERPPTRAAEDVWDAARADAARHTVVVRRRLAGALAAACLVVVAGGVWLAQRPDTSPETPPVAPIEEEDRRTPSSGPPVEGTGVVLRVEETAAADGIVTHDDLVRTTFPTDEVGASRVRAALEASSVGEPPAVLSPAAVPEVSIEASTLVLDWSADGAASELGIWSTSSGSQGLWPIIGMVFLNSDVDRLENRIDGSCEAWGERQQVGGCWQITRAEWDAYVASDDPGGEIPGPG